VFAGVLVATLISGGAGTATGPVWAFATAGEPDMFGKSSPSNGATNAPTQGIVLSWTASSNATTYEYCIDATNNSACDTSWTSNGSMTYALFGNSLPGNTTFYWHVRARNATGVTESNSGAWWSFTTRLDKPSSFGKRSPLNGASGQATDPTLSWGATIPGAPSYEYCVDTTNDNSCGTGWTSMASTSAALSGLNANTTYWWQVRARNMAGTTDADYGTWWSFTTRTPGEPGMFSKSTPPSGATTQAKTPMLTWGASSNATTYEYCLDTTNNHACDTSWISNGSATNVVSGRFGRGTRREPPTQTTARGGVSRFTTSIAIPCSYVVPTSITVQAAGSSGFVTITTSGGCAWTATSNDTSISVTVSMGTAGRYSDCR
jgi:hypothetical protein